MKCGLLGRTLGHSYSPQIHAMLGDYAYTLFEKEPEEVAAFLKNGDFTGINVTIPYKQAVIPYLDDLSDAARRIGAVNTILRRPDGSLWGHNTDYHGFSAMVQRTGLSLEGKKVLVLGSGGASRTVVCVLEGLGANPVVISRTGEDNYQNLSRHADAAVIVNTTPVGMYPNTGISPVELDGFSHLEGVLDLIYNPARTQLLLDAERRGIPSQNGLWMLVAQAKEAAEVFTGAPIAHSAIARIHHALSRQMQNLVLIGMPGCGKSTIGPLLAQATGRSFVDADETIAALAGKAIPEIFAQDGEDAFRRLETQVLADLGRRSGLVIATGGGCVTRADNYPLLHQNGILLRLERALSLLPTDGRPVSQRRSLSQLYEVRDPLYRAFADITIDNNGTPAQTLCAIAACLEERP